NPGCAITTSTKVDRGPELGLLLVSALGFAASASATVYLCRTMAGGMAMPGGWTMSMAWMRMPGQSHTAAAIMFLEMWRLMMVAMMLPSLAPALVCERRSGGRPLAMAAGYFLVWQMVGALCYAAGLALATATMRSAALSRAVPLLSALALFAAAALQSSSWK